MIIDTSAVLAIMLEERDGDGFLDAILGARLRQMSVANWLEATMVVEGRGNAIAAARFETFVQDARIELVPVSVAQAEIARRAWRIYGRGNHPAKLNYGDCFAYALAMEADEPLLFKGKDFAQTDIEPALKD